MINKKRNKNKPLKTSDQNKECLQGLLVRVVHQWAVSNKSWNATVFPNSDVICRKHISSVTGFIKLVKLVLSYIGMFLSYCVDGTCQR